MNENIGHEPISYHKLRLSPSLKTEVNRMSIPPIIINKTQVGFSAGHI